mgnify:CR=1 FL=1
MKKVVLCGATHGSNFGDTMFGLMFYQYIKQRYPDIKIYFTRISDYFKNCQENSETLDCSWKEVDGLIFISGGYFGDSPNENYRNSYFRFMNYIRFGICAKRRKIPIAVIGVGAGPIRNILIRKMIISICNNANVISVRDRQSYQFLKNNGCKNKIIITSDSAQAIRSTKFSLCGEEKHCDLSNNGKRRVLLHCPTVEVKEYTEKVIRAVDSMFKNNESVEVYFTNDSKVDKRNLEKVALAFTGNNKNIYVYDDPCKFIDFIKEMDLIITPKLHVGIFGATLGKSVISLPIHPDKTQRYYQQIGYSERCIPLSDLEDGQISELIKQYADIPIELSEDIYMNAAKNFDMLDSFIRNI